MRPAETTHQAELNASGSPTRISSVPTTYTLPPSTSNSLQSGACKCEDGSSVTILTFAISDQARYRGYFRILACKSGGQCWETHVIGVVILRLYNFAGRSILCSSSDCLCIQLMLSLYCTPFTYKFKRGGSVTDLHSANPLSY